MFLDSLLEIPRWLISYAFKKNANILCILCYSLGVNYAVSKEER